MSFGLIAPGGSTPGTTYVPMPSGLILPEAAAKASIAQSYRRPKGMDFFAGAGGMSVGSIQAGIEIVAAAEYDCYAVLTYCTNLCRYNEFKMHFITPDDEARMNKVMTHELRRQGFTVNDGIIVQDGKFHKAKPRLAGSGWIANQPRSVPGVSHVFMGDVRKLTSQRILDTLGMNAGDLDLVQGASPCQGFSKAGMQNVYDPRNSLLYEYARFIVDLNPKSFVMEEVPEVATMMDPDGVAVIDKFVSIIKRGGFDGYEAFKKVATGGPNRVGVLKSASSKKSVAKEAKRERAKASKGSAPQMDMFV